MLLLLFIIGLIKSTAFYGIITLIVGLLFFHIPFSTLFQCAFHVTNLSSAFYAFMFWSPVAYPASVLLYFIVYKIKFRNKIEFWCRIATLTRFIVTFTNPWRGLVGLIGAYNEIDLHSLYGLYNWLEVILQFVWSIALFVFIGLGFYNLIK